MWICDSAKKKICIADFFKLFIYEYTVLVLDILWYTIKNMPYFNSMRYYLQLEVPSIDDEKLSRTINKLIN